MTPPHHISVSLLLLLLALSWCMGCTDKHGHDHPHDDHAHGEPAHDEHGHGHDDHGGASEVLTRWGEHTQLFVEFPALVLNEESAFAAHLTRLEDSFAMDSGTVVVELTGGAQPAERFTVDGPSVPGIFRPVVRPIHTGERFVTLHLTSTLIMETHELGVFTVFASRAEADAAPTRDAGHEDGEISYLLEQQWRVPFRVERASTRSIRPSFPAFAQLIQQPDAEAFIISPRAGRIVALNKVFPRVGAPVEQGAELFSLTTLPGEGGDPARLDLAVEQAQILMDASQRELDRLAPLVEQGVVPQRRLDEAKSARASAEAELKSARRRRASLTQSERVGGLRDALALPSPIHGELAELLVSPGTWVAEGDRLARVVNRDRLVLSVGVPEAYVAQMRDVSGAWFRLGSAADVIEVPRAALLAVGTELDPVSRTLPVRFAIDNTPRTLFAGMHTRAYVIAQSPRMATAVPVSAIIDDSGMDVVYVQTGGESFVRRPVRLGVRDGAHVEVIEGVAPGEWVVSVGAYAVKLASTSTESIGHGHAH